MSRRTHLGKPLHFVVLVLLSLMSRVRHVSVVSKALSAIYLQFLSLLTLQVSLPAVSFLQESSTVAEATARTDGSSSGH